MKKNKIVKDFDYYMSLPYSMEIIPSPEGGYVAKISELRGCISQGETIAETVEMIEDAKKCWLDCALQDGIEIPEPKTLDDYSGKLVMRMPKFLHKRVADLAGKEGISLNQMLLCLVSLGLADTFNINHKNIS